MQHTDDFIYDIETYPNIFTIGVEQVSTNYRWMYQISPLQDDSLYIMGLLDSIRNMNGRMVGFNNNHFDYPVIHELIKARGAITERELYLKAQAIIDSNDPFAHTVWSSDWYVYQLDLFMIHHFNNKARATSLKMLEFNMRSPNIEDLPFEPGTMLTMQEMEELIEYNHNDITETRRFYEHSLDKIRFREELSERYDRDFINHNDGKIGKDYFVMRLEAEGIDCYQKNANTGRREPIQTVRQSIALKDAIFPYIQFHHPEFIRIKHWLEQQVITETKGIFKDLSCSVNGFQFDFGTGGIHGSIESSIVKSDDEYMLLDVDVASYYPNIPIANRIFPEHLSETFCEIYQDVYNQRKQYPKGTPENAMLKLALNSVFGDSNNQYSPFYDPLYMLKTTINGQLLLCLLAEHLMNLPRLQMIQINTDGLTVRIPRSLLPLVEYICKWWERFTLLELESVEYQAMYIRDVNNYIAVDVNGKVKRKGAYRHVFDPKNIDPGIGNLDWNQDHSAFVIAKAVESELLGSFNAEEVIRSHDNLYDFMLRTKVPRSSSLIAVDEDGNERKLQNTCRYYVSQTGESLVKIMPPLARKPDEWRRIGICVGWKVTPCNDIRDATVPIDYDYYINEARKLIDPLKRVS